VSLVVGPIRELVGETIDATDTVLESRCPAG
jgi:hypothetical protein